MNEPDLADVRKIRIALAHIVVGLKFGKIEMETLSPRLLAAFEAIKRIEARHTEELCRTKNSP